MTLALRWRRRSKENALDFEFVPLTIVQIMTFIRSLLFTKGTLHIGLLYVVLHALLVIVTYSTGKL